MNDFHPVVARWFKQTFERPTDMQLAAWRSIQTHRHTLIAAPTGSGKTLAAFLTSIDSLVCMQQELNDEVKIIYVSPLKALSNDIHRNLELPLGGIQQLRKSSDDATANTSAITSAVRTGDTTQSARARMLRKPPHILVTTPESLYILLTSESGRQMLSTANTVIIDEIHALAGNKRGAHLALSLERLQAVCAIPLKRIGLSATQKPIESIARFLAGKHKPQCNIVDRGHNRDSDLAIEVTASPLESVMTYEAWGEVYDSLCALIKEHRTTLIFVNTRRLAERMAKALAERLDTDAVTAHHGSLAKEHRLQAEQRLKQGSLRALVATASLELGIDIGDVDLVCQIGSPRSISVLLQRVGRSGHRIDGKPKGRLFPTTRDELVECIALLDAARRGELDRIKICRDALDVLAQQIVAEVSAGEYQLDYLFQLFRNAWPYHAMPRKKFDQVVQMLAEGYSTRRGRRAAYLHLDAVNQRIRPRKGARLTAITNGGTIPNMFDYDVILQPDGLQIGTLNEDFSFESMPGDIFQLGNTSYRIIKIEPSKVLVEDARGQPPNIPFWFGEVPGRSDELSTAVAGLRKQVGEWLAHGVESTRRLSIERYDLSPVVADQLIDYLAEAHAALGVLPDDHTVIFERFFDQAGDQHLVVHSSFGSRVNRAWGLALRKRFCRKFNFELQAAALEDTLVLSLSSTHSFALDQVVGYLKSKNVRDLLKQALLDSPMFPTHWRWNATIALAVRRFSSGKKTPAQFQRSDAEDLVAVVFPDQIACLENIAGDREIPDHPLINQTLYDCLNELMDIERLENVLADIEQGRIGFVCRDLSAPSALAQEVLTSRPYAFLDNAPAEERRTQLVHARRFVNPEGAAALGQFDAAVIEEVRREAWPQVRDVDELHDALLIAAMIKESEANESWRHWFDLLIADKRATQVNIDGFHHWVAAERLYWVMQVYPQITMSPPIEAVAIESVDEQHALVELLRCRLQVSGPITLTELADFYCKSKSVVETALVKLENEGYVMRTILLESEQEQWCERGLLARIHQRTLKQMRKQIGQVSIAGFMKFLFRWQGMDDEDVIEFEGDRALNTTLDQLEGVEVPCAAWESSVLPSRLSGYSTIWLDKLCQTGLITWIRLNPARSGTQSGPLSNSPVALMSRRQLGYWQLFCHDGLHHSEIQSPVDQRVFNYLQQSGAQFFDDIVDMTGLLNTQVEQSLAHLAAGGFVSCDSFAGLRLLVKPAVVKRGSRRHYRRSAYSDSTSRLQQAGRWSVVNRDSHTKDREEAVMHLAKALLRRYGVVFRKLLKCESNVPPWRDLLMTYRRLEARGDVRGGRFVAGFSGEQFALPEAVGLLRKMERSQESQEVAISAADPLNLTGIVLPGERVPAVISNRLLFLGGKLVATQVAGEIKWFDQLDSAKRWAATQKLKGTTTTKKYQHRISGLR